MLDLGSQQAVSKVVIYNRTSCCTDRINGCLVEFSDEQGNVVYTSDIINGEPQAVYTFPSDASAAAAAPKPQTDKQLFDAETLRYIKLRRADGRSEHINIVAMEVRDAAGNDIKGITASLNPQYGGEDEYGPQLLVDGYQQEQVPAKYHLAHTEAVPDAWMQLDLGSGQAVSKIVIHNRTSCCSDRINGCLLELSDEQGNIVYTSDLFDGAQAVYTFPEGASSELPGQRFNAGPLRYIKLRRADERSEHINIVAMEVLDAAGNKIEGISASLHPQYGGADEFGAQLLVDGYQQERTTDKYHLAHTEAVPDAWMHLDLGSEQAVSKIVIYNRTLWCSDRINGCLVELGDEQGNIVYTSDVFDGAHAVYTLWQSATQ